jgi:hypothetical protein
MTTEQNLTAAEKIAARLESINLQSVLGKLSETELVPAHFTKTRGAKYYELRLLLEGGALTSLVVDGDDGWSAEVEFYGEAVVAFDFSDENRQPKSILAVCKILNGMAQDRRREMDREERQASTIYKTESLSVAGAEKLGLIASVDQDFVSVIHSEIYSELFEGRILVRAWFEYEIDGVKILARYHAADDENGVMQIHSASATFRTDIFWTDCGTIDMAMWGDRELDVKLLRGGVNRGVNGMRVIEDMGKASVQIVALAEHMAQVHGVEIS